MPRHAELSSLTSSLEEIARRVTAVAEEELRQGDTPASRELFGVERSLGEALRRLRRLERSA